MELTVYIAPSAERYILQKDVLSRDYYLEEARDFISRILVDNPIYLKMKSLNSL